MNKIQEILDFWFEDLTDDKLLDRNSKAVKKWFMKDEKFDAEIRAKFGEDYDKARGGGHKNWEAAARGCLALVILLDQFSRNIFRDTPKAFETDSLALDLSFRSIREKRDAELLLVERIFLYMPLMHVEDRAVQKLSLQFFETLVHESRKKSPQNTPYYEYSFEFAKRHQAIIEKFGRFPHRNAILNRVSTPEETAFLEKPGSKF